MKPMKDKYLASLKQTAPSYGSLPFWSWNDKLDPEELRRQIRKMKEIGMNGFFMHARGGLETEYLSEEWYECINACVDEAKKCGMEAWSYDENGWPSGFAGGALLTDEDNLTRSIRGAVEDTFPTAENVKGVYRIEDGVCRPATADDPAPYYVVYEESNRSYVDTMRADVTKKFIDVTHEEYKRRIGADFGGVMPGFFTDEPQYYRWGTPYSRILPAEFEARFGYGAEMAYPAMFWDFEGARSMRYDYYLLCHDLFINNFVRVIYDWCEENGCQLTGHALEESFLAGQMMCCAGLMDFYQYEHIPGVDYLGRGMQSDMASRQLGSVCAQTGRKKALTETFACCGWDVSPRELKRIAEMQYAGGVNLMCQHLYPYSERGQRKRDYPAHYSEHNPWFSYMKEFDWYFANLGAILASGEEEVNTLVVHPIRAAYCDYKRLEDRASIKELDDDTLALVNRLGHAQIPYHFGDEGMMAQMASVENGRIRLGLCTYDYVIVPKMCTISSTTLALLRKLIAQGGRVHFVGGVPAMTDGRAADNSDLSSTVSFEEIRDAAPVRVVPADGGDRTPQLRQRVRAVDGQRVIFTANITEEDVFGARLVIRDCRGAVGINVHTLEEYPLAGEVTADGSLSVCLDLPAAASFVVLTDDDAQMLPPTAPRTRGETLELPDLFRLVNRPENTLTLDRVSVSTDGGQTWTEPRPLERVRDNLLFRRYEGDLALRYAFTVEDVPASASFVWENASVLSVTFNGTALTADGCLAPDPAFSRADVASLIRRGENEAILTYRYYQKPLVYDVLYGTSMESLRNCLCFDTEIENAYLVGDFRVRIDPDLAVDSSHESICYRGGFSVVAARDDIRMADIVRDGMPFFGGSVEGEATVTWKPGMPTVIRPTGRFCIGEVWVNGEHAGSMFFADEVDMAPYLREGENTVRIRLTSALRNTMGPFHRNDPEPYGVNPRLFSYEKEWGDKETIPTYLDRYAFVRFGLK